MAGCSQKPKETDLTQAVLMKLDASKVNEIGINLRCMRQAAQIHDEQPLRRPAVPFIFKTRKTWYGMRIGWDDEVVYGDWICPTYRGRWESAELLKHFKQWNLEEEIAAA